MDRGIIAPADTPAVAGYQGSLQSTEDWDEELAGIALSGLRPASKRLPSSLLYDQCGSDLFEQICATPEYYLTRCEASILESCCQEIAAVLGGGIMLVEYGSGCGFKTEILLRHLQQPVAYIPIDISSHALLASTESIKQQFPELIVLPLCADFTQPFGALPPLLGASRPVIYFPGSTIGNFETHEAIRLLRTMRLQMQGNGGALIGFDLRKDPAIISPAYNDAAGVTARFTLNVLARLNRELDADFELEYFHHRALYHEERGRIETHIISDRDQAVQVAGEVIEFRRAEEMLVELSYKYSAQEFADMAAMAGLRVERSWYDDERWFCMQYLVPA